MKNKIIGAIIIAFMAFTTLITYKSLESLSQLDLSDPFDIEEEE
jgi:hypothetical protein